MARVDGHGPKPKIQFIDDWSVLKGALAQLRKMHHTTQAERDEYRLSGALAQDIEFVLHYVPMLMDAYSEAWELMNQMMRAWENLEASKDSLYVPDAQELVQGLANPERKQL